jgi:hypothetical protein
VHERLRGLLAVLVTSALLVVGAAVVVATSLGAITS